MGQIVGFWVTCVVKMMCFVMVEADSHLKQLPASTLDIYTVFEHIDMLSMGICGWRDPANVDCLDQILGYWVTYGVKMMSFCHG